MPFLGLKRGWRFSLGNLDDLQLLEYCTIVQYCTKYGVRNTEYGVMSNIATYSRTYIEDLLSALALSHKFKLNSSVADQID